MLGYRFLDIDRLYQRDDLPHDPRLVALLLGVSLQLIPRAAEAGELVRRDFAGGGPVGACRSVRGGGSAGSPLAAAPLDRWLFAAAGGRRAPARGARRAGRRAAGPPASSRRCSWSEIDAVLVAELLVVYARERAAFTPVFARGRAVPPAFAASSPLVRTLEERAATLVAGAREQLDPFDRAGAGDARRRGSVTPIRRDGELVVVLLPRSQADGRHLHAAELALLAAIASASADVLRRIGDEAVLAEAKTMQALGR